MYSHFCLITFVLFLKVGFLLKSRKPLFRVFTYLREGMNYIRAGKWLETHFFRPSTTKKKKSHFSFSIADLNKF